jgi:hypothetical protein
MWGGGGPAGAGTPSTVWPPLERASVERRELINSLILHRIFDQQSVMSEATRGVQASDIFATIAT